MDVTVNKLQRKTDSWMRYHRIHTFLESDAVCCRYLHNSDTLPVMNRFGQIMHYPRLTVMLVDAIRTTGADPFKLLKEDIFKLIPEVLREYKSTVKIMNTSPANASQKVISKAVDIRPADAQERVTGTETGYSANHTSPVDPITKFADYISELKATISSYDGQIKALQTERARRMDELAAAQAGVDAMAAEIRKRRLEAEDPESPIVRWKQRMRAKSEQTALDKVKVEVPLPSDPTLLRTGPTFTKFCGNMKKLVTVGVSSGKITKSDGKIAFNNDSRRGTYAYHLLRGYPILSPRTSPFIGDKDKVNSKMRSLADIDKLIAEVTSCGMPANIDQKCSAELKEAAESMISLIIDTRLKNKPRVVPEDLQH